MPSAFQSAEWAAGADADEVTGIWHFPTGPETARLRVSADGEPEGEFFRAQITAAEFR